jgi:hypothetical protein
MLNKQQSEQVEQLVDGQYMRQVEDAGFEAALEGVQLAISIVQHISGYERYKELERLLTSALRYLHKFGNWQAMSFSHDDRAQILQMERESGENE